MLALATLLIVVHVSPVRAQRRDQLRDHSITSSGPVLYLDSSSWTATNSRSGLAISATVPGDIITDLQRAAVVPDPYFNVSWRDPRHVDAWANGTWTFERRFDYLPVATAIDPLHVLLVFDSIKMGAHIKLNGKTVGTTTDQFLRYTFEVGQLLKPTGNVLQLEFAPEIDTEGRLMTCTGGYDWAPWATTFKVSPSVRSTVPSG